MGFDLIENGTGMKIRFSVSPGRRNDLTTNEEDNMIPMRTIKKSMANTTSSPVFSRVMSESSSSLSSQRVIRQFFNLEVMTNKNTKRLFYGVWVIFMILLAVEVLVAMYGTEGKEHWVPMCGTNTTKLSEFGRLCFCFVLTCFVLGICMRCSRLMRWKCRVHV